MNAPHLLDIDGPAQTGGWYCRRCNRTFAYHVDGRGPCPEFPWAPERITAFQTRVRRLHAGVAARLALRGSGPSRAATRAGDLLAATTGPRPTT